MKKLFFVLPFVALMACEKEKVSVVPDPIPQSSSSPLVSISGGTHNSNLVYSDSSNTFVSGIFLGQSINRMFFSEEIFLELQTLNQVSAYEYTGTGIIKTLEFKNFESNSNSFSFEIVVNGSSDFYTISSAYYSIDDFKSVIANGFSTSGKVQANPIWWIFPVVTVIVETVETVTEHCSQIVTQGITACSSQNKCFEAYFCSVKCVSCGS